MTGPYPFRPVSFDAEQIVRELYNPGAPGGILIPELLAPETRQRLLGDIAACSSSFQRAPRAYGNALREFDYLHLGEADEERITGEFPHLFALRDRYADVYNRTARHASFSPSSSLNSIAVHRYWEGSLGITPHRDESGFVNLISVFVLSGTARFYICGARDQYRPQRIRASWHPGAGDLILLRAPRSDAEHAWRPLHGVGPVTAERYTITFRERRTGTAHPE